MLQDNPLWLPAGSVRALIFIAMTIGVLSTPLIYPEVDIDKWFTLVSTAWLIIIGHYFEKRSIRNRRIADELFYMERKDNGSNSESSSRSSGDLLPGKKEQT